MLFHRSLILLLALTVCALAVNGQEATAQTAASTVVRLTADGSIELNNIPQGSLKDLDRLKAGLTEIFAGQEALDIEQPVEKPALTSCREHPVIIRADAALNYGAVVDLLLAIRALKANPILVEVSSEARAPYALTPNEPCLEGDLEYVAPNPLTLVVVVTSDHRLLLNQDEMGNTSDTARLRRKLSELFARREKMEAYRPGTGIVEKTLFVKAARALTFGEVLQVLRLVKEVGADPVGLQIDDLLSRIRGN